MNTYATLTILTILFIQTRSEPRAFQITWENKLTGDFTFAKKRTMQCEAWCYEWAGTDKVIVIRQKEDTLMCETAMNEGTHCSLRLTITKNSCIPTIRLLSVAAGGNKLFQARSGFIRIDKKLYQHKMLKADFNFKFENPENDREIFWKGKILTKID